MKYNDIISFIIYHLQSLQIFNPYIIVHLFKVHRKQSELEIQ